MMIVFIAFSPVVHFSANNPELPEHWPSTVVRRVAAGETTSSTGNVPHPAGHRDDLRQCGADA
jgi:hypothetical protein